jgi:hypothetical protein
MDGSKLPKSKGQCRRQVKSGLYQDRRRRLGTADSPIITGGYAHAREQASRDYLNE